jgi:hypothetical protein
MLPPSLTPLIDGLSGLFGRLAARLTGVAAAVGAAATGAAPAAGAPASAAPAGAAQLALDPALGDLAAAAQAAGLDPTLLGAMAARVQRAMARFLARIGTKVPPPRPQPMRDEPRFLPTYRLRMVSADDPPEPPKLPRFRGWLPRLVPGFASMRAELEEFLRRPEMAALLADDPRLGRCLRPACWMLGVDRSVLPPSGWQHRVVIMVPGGPRDAAKAAADYAAGRAKGVSHADLRALGCYGPEYFAPPGRRPTRLAWRGCAGIASAGHAKNPA